MSKLTAKKWFESNYGKANHGKSQFTIMEQYADYAVRNLSINEMIETIYLQYINDYLTVRKMADDNNIDVDMLRKIIKTGIRTREDKFKHVSKVTDND